MDLRQATENLIAFEAALEDQTARDAEETKRVVAAYNEDDCRATLALRDWLEQRRAELAERLGEDLPRPAAVEEPPVTEDPEVTRIRSALLAGLPGRSRSLWQAVTWSGWPARRRGRCTWPTPSAGLGRGDQVSGYHADVHRSPAASASADWHA